MKNTNIKNKDKVIIDKLIKGLNDYEDFNMNIVSNCLFGVGNKVLSEKENTYMSKNGNIFKDELFMPEAFYDDIADQYTIEDAIKTLNHLKNTGEIVWKKLIPLESY